MNWNVFTEWVWKAILNLWKILSALLSLFFYKAISYSAGPFAMDLTQIGN